MSESLPSLESLRQEIDRIDSSIQDLINARARCAQQVAEVKRVSQPDATVFYRPEREAQVLQKVMARNTGPLHAEEMARLFREIMSACLALEQQAEAESYVQQLLSNAGVEREADLEPRTAEVLSRLRRRWHDRAS